MSKRSDEWLERKTGIPTSERKTGDEAVSALLATDREHVRPMAARDKFSRTAMTLVQVAADALKEGCADPEFVREYIASLRSGVRERDRTCMNIYPRLIGLLGENQRLVIEIWSNLGVKDEHEARQKIAMAQSVEGASPHDGAQTCVGYLESYLAMYPAQRTAIVQRLGGMVAASSADYADTGSS